MIEENNILKSTKKQILITIISVGLIVISLGYFTFAYYMDIKESNTNVINYGDLSLTFCATSSCASGVENIGRTIGLDASNNPLYVVPQTQEQALATTPYIFKLTNSGDYEMWVTIKLIRTENPTLNASHSLSTPVDSQYVNTAFGVSGSTPIVEKYSDLKNNNELYSLHMNAGESVVFNLWTWLIDNSPNSVQGQYFIADIEVKGEYFSNYSLKTVLLSETPSLSDENIDFSEIASVNNTTGFYYTEDETVETYGEDGEKIYYFRGNANENWVSFAGYFWRIIRTTSEGGVKLLYSGNRSTDSSAFIASSKFNSIDNNKYYVGYTFKTSLDGYDGAKADQTKSTVNKVLNAWYSGGTTTDSECYTSGVAGNCDFSGLSTKLSSYSEYLSSTAVYCNDRSTEEVIADNVYFPARSRVGSSIQRPSFACQSDNNSEYTVSSTTGNGYLDYSIGLLSADEAEYAMQDYYLDANENSYIKDNAKSQDWWLLSPFEYSSSSSKVMMINDEGTIGYDEVTAVKGIRPVISLKSCIIPILGKGTHNNPYILSNIKC